MKTIDLKNINYIRRNYINYIINCAYDSSIRNPQKLKNQIDALAYYIEFFTKNNNYTNIDSKPHS